MIESSLILNPSLPGHVPNHTTINQPCKVYNVALTPIVLTVASIRRWWVNMGQEVYPDAKELLICADGGGSNGYRVRLWKVELQSLATETGLGITICHFPPGTSKWNKIEHRLFSHISMNWRGRPLISHEVIVKLIGKTSTRNGLRVKAKLG